MRLWNYKGKVTIEWWCEAVYISRCDIQNGNQTLSLNGSVEYTSLSVKEVPNYSIKQQAQNKIFYIEYRFSTYLLLQNGVMLQVCTGSKYN